MNNKKKFFILFGDTFIFTGIAILVTVLWQLLELYIYGEIKLNEVDTIIALFLTISIYINCKIIMSK